MKILATLRARAGEQGMSTSEYAVGTVGACAVGGVLVKVAQSDFFNNFVTGVIQKGLELLPF
ncbi:uncharacterized protein DUF4244 [Mumia flava]|uniref:Uncharacterized protein DUF4244 n=1 Tax=Mumia flava TaxID=1348852 RepID=A0A0B2BJM7_9ACTN|nr:DUF4244 domain-containing protein [Mumia flava]PJJ57367.1 uncharacterized protein DUF4244 [Mumia flava]